MAALFFAQARWDGNNRAGVSRSDRIVLAVGSPRAGQSPSIRWEVMPMTDFTELVKLLTAMVSLLTALVGLSKALKQGSKPKKTI